MADEVGYQRKAYVGAAGSAASTQVTNAIDLNESVEHTNAPTTVRGTGAVPPIATSNVAIRVVGATMTMQHDPADAVLGTILAAVEVGGPIAFKLTTGSGVTKLNIDATVGMSMENTLEGGSIYTFTFSPTKQSGRTPAFS